MYETNDVMLVLADVAKRGVDTVTFTSTPSDLGIDSLGMLKLIVKLEARFGVAIDGGHLETIAEGNAETIASVLNDLRAKA